jgi:hypothetical protein
MQKASGENVPGRQRRFGAGNKTKQGESVMKRISVVACAAVILAAFLIPAGAGAFDQKVYDEIIFCMGSGISRTFARVDLTNADFTWKTVSSKGSTNMRLISWQGSDLSGARFTDNVNLDYAGFQDAILNRTDFSGANLTDARFDKATMLDTIFSASTILTGARFNGAHIGGLTNIYVSQHLEGADFSGAYSDTFVCAPGSIGKCNQIKK